jgi:hypothetical protein
VVAARSAAFGVAVGRSVGKPMHACERYGHVWNAMMVDGWVRCERLGCRAYAVCPACLGCVVSDVVVRFCAVHLGEAGSLSRYPSAVREAPEQTSSSYAQETLW